VSRRFARTRRTLGRLDRALLAAAIRHRSPVRNKVMTSTSTAANHSMLWIAIAGGLAATGRRKPRSAASGGLLGISIAATLVNGPLKFAWRRDRPPSVPLGGGEPLLPLPRTFSFPSGHAASAFAFAVGASRALPPAAPVLLPLASAVAYSRVHTGVHYPSDVAVGATVGAASGLVAAHVVQRMRERSVHRVAAPALPVSVPRHAVLISSEDSGSADGLTASREVLDRAGVVIDKVVDVQHADELKALVRGVDAPPLVIAAGGDGTVCAATNLVAGTNAVLAVLPLGTSNDVARSLGIPPDPIEAAEVITAGRVCEVDIAQVCLSEDAPRMFVNAATVGLNVAFARLATESSIRDRFGGLTYPIAAARALRGYEPFECTIECDGETRTVSAVHVSVSNAPVFGGVLGMRVPGASLNDGLLDVIVIEPLSSARLALAVADAMIGRHDPVHGVHAMRVPAIRISASPAQEIALDGEVIGKLPAEFRAVRNGLRVVVPAVEP
jgi:undecaprenyl-diphosphatase